MLLGFVPRCYSTPTAARQQGGGSYQQISNSIKKHANSGLHYSLLLTEIARIFGSFPVVILASPVVTNVPNAMRTGAAPASLLELASRFTMRPLLMTILSVTRVNTREMSVCALQQLKPRLSLTSLCIGPETWTMHTKALCDVRLQQFQPR